MAWGAASDKPSKQKATWGAQTSKTDKERAVDQDDKHQFEGQIRVGLFGTVKKIK